MSGLFFASFFNKNIFLCISSAAVIVLILRIKGAVLRDFVIIAVSFVTGAGYFGLYTHFGYDKIISLSGTYGNFSGEVTDIRLYDGDNASYTLKGKINGKLSAKVNLFTDNQDAGYGDIIDIRNCKFSVFENSYIFNAEDYYKSENIYLSANNAESIEIYHRNSRKVKNLLAQYRDKMMDKFRIILGDECGGFMAGMIFGEKQSVEDNLKTALYRSGIGHVLSVSGLHVSIIAAFLMLLLRKTGVNKFLSFGILNIFMLLLVIMANSPVSAVRAMIMLDFIYSAALFYRQNDTFNSLAWAALVICIVNPYSIYSSGFVLSFAGTFGIGVFAPYMTKDMKKDTALQKLKYNFMTALCTSVMIFPFGMYYFDETSLISPVSNIILVPLCTASMLTGAVYILTGGLVPIIYAAYIFIKPVIYLSEKAAAVNIFHVSRGGEYSAYILLCLCAVCAAVHMIFGNRKILTAAISVSFAVFLVVCTAYSVWRYNHFIISVLGRGTNAAVVICFKGDVNIIDLSGNYRSADYVGKYISANGIERINNLIFTRNINSLYSSYMHEFEYHKIKNIIKTDGKFSIAGNFSADFGDDVLSVAFSECRMVLSPAKEGNEYGGLNIFYGNIPSSADIPYDGIYLDKHDDYKLSGMNNFEIVVYGDGVYRIRSL